MKTSKEIFLSIFLGIMLCPMLVYGSADLASLKHSYGKRSPDQFDPNVTTYNITVDSRVRATNFYLTAATAHDEAKITVDGVQYANNAPILMKLVEGAAPNSVVIDVAGPGTLKKSYTVNVYYRQPSGVMEHPTKAWLFWDDFETGDLRPYGSYSKGGKSGPNQFVPWQGIGLGHSQGMRAEFREADGEQYTNGALHVFFGAVPEGSSEFKSIAAPGEYLTEVYARFYFRCDETWDFGGADKICRMTSMQGSNYSQAMIAHIWSTGHRDEGTRPTGHYLCLDPATGVDVFNGNAQTMREGGPNRPATNSKLLTTRYNDFPNLSWTGGKRIPIPFFDADHVGQWYCIEMRVKLNDPGKSNGIYEVWVDDVLQVSLTDMNWIGSCEVGPGKFFGINAFYLENYCNGGVKGNQVRYFDNLVVSREKIGMATLTYTDGLHSSQQPQKERFPNFASSSLPQGNGFAADFKADAGVEKHPDVIFADNFEAGEMGAKWDEVKTAKALSFVNPGDKLCGKRCVRVESRLGENQGGGFIKWFESADRVFVRFYTRIDPDCDYIHHFVTLRASKGLKGQDMWSGFGGAGLRPEGDGRFSTSLEPVGGGGRWPAPGVWNSYSYWHEMEMSRDRMYWGNAFRPDSQEVIKKGQWICAEFMLKHNTPGQEDGEQAFWIDGKLMGHWYGINWRKSATLMANSLTLESYVTDRWTTNEVNIVFFDNLVIAREYIGPAGN